MSAGTKSSTEATLKQGVMQININLLECHVQSLNFSAMSKFWYLITMVQFQYCIISCLYNFETLEL